MRILVGISGGVDSAYCLLKLMREGHDVEACVLKMHEYTDTSSAREVAESLGVKLHEIDATISFNNIIKENFISEYLSGRTPNPCILCNERVKFAMLYDFAMKNGFDKIATGHYARVVKLETPDGERYAIAKAEDESKEQSYMLYRLTQKILSKLILPLADDCKGRVREVSAEAGIPVANKKDSQEICFLPDGKHADYIESVRGECPRGSFIDTDGNVLGEHKGIIRYTVGQRKGLGIALGERVFVTKIDPINNTVTLSPELIGKRTVRLSDMIYSGMAEPRENRIIDVQVKIRYKSPMYNVKAELMGEGNAVLHFCSEIMAAPGQSAVLYIDGYIVAGGIITE
ncbi:MAG: tRNA 2-thiouridine(34) synthase MnmA [Clostridia bacterium]|nr:tRNA 2-thiouridine(34) synthase MnmA [Clostridia bacterium]